MKSLNLKITNLACLSDKCVLDVHLKRMKSVYKFKFFKQRGLHNYKYIGNLEKSYINSLPPSLHKTNLKRKWKEVTSPALIILRQEIIEVNHHCIVDRKNKPLLHT